MTIVIPTEKSNEEYMNSLHGRCLSSIQRGFKQTGSNNPDQYDLYVPKDKFEIVVVENNKEGLSKCYNDCLSKLSHDDIALFMHDDVEIHDQFFVEKLQKAHQYFDIVGLAGAIEQKYLKGRNHLWHLSTDQKNLRGFVSHYFPQGYYNSSYFGATPSGVDVIDGLFMSVKVSSLKENYDLFDEDFTFHHYDMAMCRKAKDKGLKMGVWPIFVIHHGLGEFDKPEWYSSNTKFDQKYAK